MFEWGYWHVTEAPIWACMGSFNDMEYWYHKPKICMSHHSDTDLANSYWNYHCPLDKNNSFPWKFLFITCNFYLNTKGHPQRSKQNLPRVNPNYIQASKHDNKTDNNQSSIKTFWSCETPFSISKTSHTRKKGSKIRNFRNETLANRVMGHLRSHGIGLTFSEGSCFFFFFLNIPNICY